MSIAHTDVAIIGGGPAGLMLAIELGCRGVPCVLLEEDADCPALPKANATSARTMEHYRRRGFAHLIRALGLPPEHAQDVVYTTHIAGPELTRFRIPSAAQAAQQASFGDYGALTWPTPELPHRAQQMLIEPILKAQAQSYPSVTARFACRAVSVLDPGDRVQLEYVDAAGLQHQLQATYAVGCDGPRSMVRQAMGVRYAGEGGARRDFFGGQMVSIYFRAAGLAAAIGKPAAWQYWALNPRQRALLCSIDGAGSHVLMIQLPPEAPVADVDVARVFANAIGAPFDYEVLAITPWTAGHALVAERFAQGRLFLAGDAAHLFTPTGGMGYNTSVDDVVNLGWKLALVCGGCASASLLDSYEAERRPIAQRNTDFARRMADSIGRMVVPAHIDEASVAGEQARQDLAPRLAQHVASEFNIPGLQLGLSYAGSPIVASEPGAAPPDDPNHYLPHARPGARAPHVALGDASWLDRFGRDFTLLVLDDGLATQAWADQAARRGLWLHILRCDDAAVRALYAAPLVLIRPDHHIAWRGGADEDADAVLALATGSAGG